MLFSIAGELDASGLDIWVAAASGMYFSVIDSRPPPSDLRMLGFITGDDLAAVYRKAFCFACRAGTKRRG